MLSSILRWFEGRITPFEGGGDTRPPETLFAFYWHFVRQVWPAFVALLVAGFFGAVIEAALMAFIGNLVDMMRLAANPQSFFSDHSGTLLFMAFIAMIARPIVSAMHDTIKNQIIAGSFTTRIRWQTHSYVLRQSLGFFQNDFAGRVANKIMQTGAALRTSVVNMIDTVWFVGIYVATAFGLFIVADWRLVLPLVGWLGVYVVTLRHFLPRIRARAVIASEARSMLTGRIVDSYTNVQTVKLFAHTDREDQYARDAMQEQLDAWNASLRLITTMEFWLYAMNGVLIASSSALALWLWSLGAVTIGDIALTTGLIIRIVSMSGWVMFTVTDIFENIGIVQEGMETISRPLAVLDKPQSKPLSVPKGEIRFDAIHFDYGRTRKAGDGRPGGVIEDLTLTVAPGEKVGLVGRSGAGKSTLINLLLRFYDLERGRILIDGTDISEATQDSLRARIGVVTQDTSLLHRSVRDNILYGLPDAPDPAVVAAAKRAHAHDFILGLRDLRGRTGYDAHVGERGVKLSGGQRQRIAIARVLLKNAPILVLDEATSALDSEVEAAIQEQLINLMSGKTVIAIAHRLSTIAAMDRLIVMDNGRVIEEGRHAELLKRGGLYAKLWARQSGGFLAKEAAE